MNQLPEILQRINSAAEPAERATLVEQALMQVRRADDPILWGSLQGTLAASVAEAIGGRYTQETFDKVLGGYEGALAVFTPTEYPEEWATTLRNIGTAHREAAESGLADVQGHIEAAIAAFGQATTVSPDVKRDVWIGAHCDLAAALWTASAWRGSSAFRDCASEYEAVLGRVSKEEAPEFWASLHVQYAEAIGAAGDVNLAGDAIRACEQALQVLSRETRPAQWALVQLMLGEFYRARPDGDRADSLERAAAALDAALTVFTKEDFPDEWLRAHYHLGPVLVFRTARDRNENLRRALDSLRIAVAGVSRDDAPETWASLQVVLAQALLDRTDGDLQEHLETAIPTLEAALQALPSNEPSMSWLLAKRFLGGAYLRREAGDELDNLERGISALEDAQCRDIAQADLDAWTVAQANLGQAYARRPGGDRAQNRAKAVAALTSAVAIPIDDARPWQGWGSAQAWLTLLSMSDAEHRFDLKDSQGTQRQSDVAEADGIAALAAIEEGQQPLALDPRWRVPFHLEDDAHILQRQLDAFLNSGTVPVRGVHERFNLEAERHARARSMAFQLEERRSAGRRTEALFRDIQSQGRPFVLYLRGFNNRIARFPQGNVVRGTGNLEWFALAELVKSVAPMAVVWAANPVDSSAIDMMVSEKQEHELGFRVEVGEEWEQHVRALIASASFIVMRNSAMTPGVVAEIGFLSDAGRLKDTYFEDATAANQATGRSDGRSLNPEALVTMRVHSTLRTPPVALPPAMCPWVGGPRRSSMERGVEAVEQLLGRLEAAHRSVLRDLALDASSWLIGRATLLERRAQLAGLLARQAAQFERLAGESNYATALAESCSKLASQLSRE